MFLCVYRQCLRLFFFAVVCLSSLALIICLCCLFMCLHSVCTPFRWIFWCLCCFFCLLRTHILYLCFSVCLLCPVSFSNSAYLPVCCLSLSPLFLSNLYLLPLLPPPVSFSISPCVSVCYFVCLCLSALSLLICLSLNPSVSQSLISTSPLQVIHSYKIKFVVVCLPLLETEGPPYVSGPRAEVYIHRSNCCAVSRVSPSVSFQETAKFFPTLGGATP